MLQLIYPSPEVCTKTTLSAIANPPIKEVDVSQDFHQDVSHEYGNYTLKQEGFVRKLSQEDKHQDVPKDIQVNNMENNFWSIKEY